ncbi:MAG: aminodeoxychorismate/anthranilate synthase component II [Bacteroidota bacterium]
MESTILLLDNFDSFTYNLADYLGQAGVQCTVLRNDVGLAEIQRSDYKGIVLSPGPGTPQQAGCMREVIDYYHRKLPMLGICLGHQALGEFFGAPVTKANRPMHGKISEVVTYPDALFVDIPERIRVVRYHSLVLQALPKPLECIAETADGEMMAFRHPSLPLRGVQFHPEAALTEYGLQMLKNWLSFHRLIPSEYHPFF